MTMNAENFPARVRAARKRRKWSQQDLADAAGVSLRTVQNMESGEVKTQPANLAAILAATGIDPDGASVATQTREAWPTDLQVFLDVMGAYLMTFPEDERIRRIHDLTRQIFERGRP